MRIFGTIAAPIIASFLLGLVLAQGLWVGVPFALLGVIFGVTGLVQKLRLLARAEKELEAAAGLLEKSNDLYDQILACFPSSFSTENVEDARRRVEGRPSIVGRLSEYTDRSDLSELISKRDW